MVFLLKKDGGMRLFAVLLSLLFAYFVYSFPVGTTTIDVPVARANLTGNVNAQITISNLLGGTNVTNVTFFFANNTGVRQIIGSNTSQNLTVYTINWATTTAGTGEGINFTFFANVTYYNMTGPDVNVSTASVGNITIDNTRPLIAPNAPVNNTNTSSAVVTFNFTVIDTVDTVFDCNLTLDPVNSTFGAIINTSTTVLNGTATTFVNTIQEGRHTWNVRCLDTVSLSNQTNNFTFSVATTVPTVTLNFPPNLSILNNTGFAFNFTPISIVFSLFTDCNLTINPTNTTGGGIINSSSNVVNGSVISYQTTPADGDRTWNVQCRDPADNVAFSTNNTFTFDSSAPVINMSFIDPLNSLPSTSFGLGSEVLAKCARGDSITGVNHTEILLKAPYDQSFISKKVDNTLVPASSSTASTEYTITGEDTNELGTYTVECRAVDKAGIILIRNSTFEVEEQAPEGGNAFAVRGFSAPVGKIKINSGVTSEGGALTADGLSRLMMAGASLKLNIKGNDHTITISSIADDSVTLVLNSEPLTMTVKKGETVDVDLDKDGTNDIAITYHKRFPPGGKHADLTFKMVSSPVTVMPEEGGEAAEGRQDSLARMIQSGAIGLVVTLLIIALVVVFGYFFLVSKKR